MKLRDFLKTYKSSEYEYISIYDETTRKEELIKIVDAIEKYGDRSVRLWDMTEEYICGYQNLEVCIV